MPPAHARETLHPTLTPFAAVAIMVGLVLGIGIFRTPSIVAANVVSEAAFIGVWVAGGLATLVGALCYAELAAAYPHAGGEYHFLSRAYGRPVAMMFGWARCSVIQTGSIAAVAFVFGDYLARLLPFGEQASAIYAALAVVVFTAVNIAGTRQGKNVQVVVTLLVVAAIGAVIVGGLLAPSSTGLPPVAPAAIPADAAIGMAMIFVLLTYGGWNEAAYLAGEMHAPQRNVVRVLAVGTLVLATLYVLVNLAFLNVLGLEGGRASDAVAAETMRRIGGPAGEWLVTFAILVAAVSTVNATIFTGARVFYVMARDMRGLRWVGTWDERGATPVNGYIAQGVVALALIAMGAVSRDGFKAMVDYTAPVFWAFLLLVGIALFVLRRRDPRRQRPYRVPLYPLTPFLFCLTCAYMLWSSIRYTGNAGLLGLGVLLLGTPLLLLQRKGDTTDAAGSGGIGQLPPSGEEP